MVKPATLDRSRGFQQVCGGTDAVRYLQDDKKFDGRGIEILAAARSDDYETWKAPQLRASIIERAGKVPRPGTTKVAMIETLRALDAVRVVDPQASLQMKADYTRRRGEMFSISIPKPLG